MRIYGNRLIKTLPGTLTRPTTSRVREAIFEIWRRQMAGCRWLDLCCGSGSMGAEALCRGASLVVGIEQSGRACAVIRENWQRIARPDQNWQVLRGDVGRRLPKLTQTFDRIYFDPPYDGGIYEKVLGAIASKTTHIPVVDNSEKETATIAPLLALDGELGVEHAPTQMLPQEIHGIIAQRTKIYGNSAVTFYRWGE